MELRRAVADLADLAGRERDSGPRQAILPGLGGGRGGPNEPIVFEPDAELLQTLRSPADPSYWKRVVELVGEDPADDRSLGEVSDALPERDRKLRELFPRGRAALDRGQPRPGRDGRMVARERPGEVGEKPPLSRADFDEVEISFDILPILREPAGDRRGKRRRNRRRRDEVSALSDRRSARVIAGVGIVERRLHEVGERNRPLAPDAVA